MQGNDVVRASEAAYDRADDQQILEKAISNRSNLVNPWPATRNS